MNNSFSLCRRLVSRLAGILLPGFLLLSTLDSALAPELAIKQVKLDSPGHVTITYDAEAGASYTLLQGHSVTNINTPVATNSGAVGAAFFAQTVAATNRETFFLIAATLPLTTIRETSPLNGESGVSVTRETIVRFSAPLAADAIVLTNNFYAGFGGRRLLSRIELSSDRHTATLFYLEPIPGGTRIYAVFDGTGLNDELGRPLDADGDGQPGGSALIAFDTYSTTALAGTAVIGRVFASELMSANSVTPNNIFANPSAPAPNLGLRRLDAAFSSGTPGASDPASTLAIQSAVKPAHSKAAAAPPNAADSLDRPLEGVIVTVDGREQDLRAVTDANGNFKLDPAPPGRFFVHIDGRTAKGSSWPNGSYYPVVGKAWEAVAGRADNLAGGTGQIYLPLITAGTLQPVSATAETTITFPPSVTASNPALTGVTLTVPANALFSDDGTRGGKIGIAPVPPDRLPSPLPPGLNFPLVITVQTDGPLNFDTPVSVRFPNLPDPKTGIKLPPGEKSALWSFNHDTGEWEIQGPMTVSADGNFVESDPGVGVRQPGWHGTAPGIELRLEPDGPPCEDVGLADMLDLAKAIASCIRELSKAIEVAEALLSLFHDIPSLIDSVQTLRNDYASGTVSVVGVKNAAKNIKKQKDNIVTIYDALSAENPVSIFKQKAQCVLGLVSTVTDLICKRAECIGPTVDAMCPQIQAVLALGKSLLDKADELDNAIRNAPFTALCGALDAFIAGLDATSLSSVKSQSATAPDPTLLALMDDVIGKGKAFQTQTLATEAVQNTLTVTSNQTVTLQKTLTIPLTDIQGLANKAYKLSTAGTILFTERGRIGSGGSGIWTLPTVQGTGGTGFTFEILDSGRSIIYTAHGYIPMGVKGFIGSPSKARNKLWFPLTSTDIADVADSDADGLPDIAEDIIGTDPSNPDTDGDGIKDGAEIIQGTDPLDGLPARTGIIATASTPGTAVDVCALNDLAIVAEGAAGVTVFNVFNGMNPVRIIQVDTPGNAQRVACSGSLVAVADGPAGLAIIDISDPPNARIIHQVALSGSAQAVTAAGGIAYVGTDSGQIAAVDLASGTVLDQVSAGGFIHDLGIEGDVLFALIDNQLRAYELIAGGMEFAGFANTSGFGAPFITGKNRLFVGGGHAYASSLVGYDVFDVRNPAALQRVGSAQSGGPISFKQIVANGSGLGIAAVGVNRGTDDTHHINLYDLSNPTNTTQFITTLPTPGVARAVSLYNGLAYVADSDSGMQVINYLAYDSKGIPPTITLTNSFPMTSSTNGVAEEAHFARTTATVTDDVQVRNVEFYIDGVKVATDGNFPFEYRFVTPRLSATVTNFTVRAKATDTGGNFTWSETIEVVLSPDVTSPKLMQTFPTNYAVINVTNSVNALFAYFSEPIDQATLNSTNLYVLTPGPDNRLGTADDLVLPSGIISFRDTLNVGVITFPNRLPLGLYRLVVGSGVRDLIGNLIAAPGNSTFAVLNGGPDEDDDNDDLSNGDELSHGTNPLVADTDGDGWIDSIEVNDGTDPWDASSKPRSTYLAAPPLQIELPSAETYGTAGSPTVLAQPPLTIDFPGAETLGISGTPLHLAKPPVSVKISP
ncbi:MAG: hypothetical protein HY043_05695 [Verrucomicrobia bacterium]|nr:hypothetical protein [Verrucomicrobiota bacterium]